MSSNDYKLIKRLVHSVYNRKLGISFGTQTRKGWFSAAPVDTSVNRAIRTNNPGALNISGWQKQRPGYAGFTDADSAGNRTTIYQTPEHGVAAWKYLVTKIYGFESAGQFDVGTLARRYAGSNAPQSAIDVYIRGWSRWSSTPMDGNTVIHLNAPDEVLNFAKALFAHEAAARTPLHDEQIGQGFALDAGLLERRQALIDDIVGPQSIIDILEKAREDNSVEEVYEAGLADTIIHLGENVLLEPTPEKVSAWLQIYALVSDLSLEGPAEITGELLTNRHEFFDEVAGHLSPEVLFAIDDLGAALESTPLSFEQMIAASNAAATNAGSTEWSTVMATRPILANVQHYPGTQ